MVLSNHFTGPAFPLLLSRHGCHRSQENDATYRDILLHPETGGKARGWLGPVWWMFPSEDERSFHFITRMSMGSPRRGVKRPCLPLKRGGLKYRLYGSTDTGHAMNHPCSKSCIISSRVIVQQTGALWNCWTPLADKIYRSAHRPSRTKRSSSSTRPSLSFPSGEGSSGVITGRPQPVE